MWLISDKNPTQPVVLVQYACVTPEGARIDGSTFINTEITANRRKEFRKEKLMIILNPKIGIYKVFCFMFLLKID